MEPREEASPAKAPIGQDYRTNALGKCPNHAKERILLELVLALVRGEGVPVVGQLQERQGSSLAGDSDAQDLLAYPLAGGHNGVEEGPVDSQSQPAGEAQSANNLGHESHLGLQRVHSFVVGEAPEPLEAVQQGNRSCLGAATRRSSGVG